MKALKSVGALVACLLVAGMGLGTAVVAYNAKNQAHSSLEQARRLRDARLEVARAQEALGSSDINDAAEAGDKANAVALRVGQQIDRIAQLLGPLQSSATRSTTQGRKGIRGAIAARRQTQVAADVLEALAGYQIEASENAVRTNRALRRILVALQKTNRNFP